MKRDKEKMIRDDKQDFHFVGFQEENADTIPSEIPCKPVVKLFHNLFNEYVKEFLLNLRLKLGNSKFKPSPLSLYGICLYLKTLPI